MLPEQIIPNVLLFLDLKEIHRCAGINTEWEQCVKDRKIKIREEAAWKRAQVLVDPTS